MKIGTKSLLFGMHLWFWHPIMVWRAWRCLYGRPSFKELVCIFIHDWGYWGKPNLDGPEGILHPDLGAYIAFKLFGYEHWELCAGHSRSFVAMMREESKESISPSKLCWADKLAFIYEPRWFYLLRAGLSGELQVARDDFQRVPPHCSNKDWFDATYAYFVHEVFQALLNDPEYHGLIRLGRCLPRKAVDILRGGEKI